MRPLQLVVFLVLILSCVVIESKDSFDTLNKYFNNRLDINKNGKLDADEIRKYSCNVAGDKGHCGTDDQIKEVLNFYDKDQSGDIALEEIVGHNIKSQVGSPVGPEVEQVHLALTTKPTEMVVMWVTRDRDPSIVEYGLSTAPNYTYNQNGTSATYNVGVDGWHGWIHTVTLTGLTPATQYMYRCGSSSNWSQRFTFTTAPVTASSPQVINGEYKIAVVADMGTVIPMGWAVTDQMTADNQQQKFNMILHAGDVCYAGTGSTYEVEEVWDVWGNQMQKIAAYVPYMFAVGNHEHYYNFTSFRTRYHMPGDQCGGEGNFWYSIDYGNIHFTFMSTEHPYSPGSPQYQWLVNDLAKADQNRKVTPWIIVSGHRPMYNSDVGEWDQHRPGAIFQTTIEPLFQKFHVDLYLAGHMHMYERIYPTIDGVPTNTGNYYVNPKGTAHVVQATAGVFTDSKYINPQPVWSAARDNFWGYGRLHVLNETHLHYSFMHLKNDKVADEFWIQKDY